MEAILNKLEYNEIIDVLEKHCKTYLGKNLCDSLKPSFSFELVDVLLNETKEADTLLHQKGTPPFYETDELEKYIKILKSNQTLSIKGLLNIGMLLKIARELKEYFYSPESAYQYTEGQLLHQEDKEFLDTVTSIIKENVSKEGLGPDLVADALNINTRILYRRFKKISTMTPSDFIKDYRLNYAAQLLVNTNMSVQEIIYNVGISNKSYFYREFARKYNMTPKEYRTKEA